MVSSASENVKLMRAAPKAQFWSNSLISLILYLKTNTVLSQKTIRVENNIIFLYGTQIVLTRCYRMHFSLAASPQSGGLQMS